MAVIGIRSLTARMWNAAMDDDPYDFGPDPNLVKIIGVMTALLCVAWVFKVVITAIPHIEAALP